MTMKRTMNRKALVAPLFALLVHCANGGPASSAQATTPEGGAGDDAGNDAGELAPDGQAAPSSQGDAGGCDGGNGTVDLPDDMGIDANCDGADGVIGKDVYVDANVGQDTNAGTPSAPLQTLSAGLRLATSRGGNVLVAAGTLTDDDLSAAGTWAMYGGYASNFLGAPKRALTIVTPPATGLLIEQATSAHLAHMTVQAQAPQSGPSSSAHAVRSSAATLVLDDMDLQAPPGADAPAGAPGATGEAGNSSNQCGSRSNPTFAMGTSSGNGKSPDGHTVPGNVPQKIPAAQAQSGYAGSDGNDALGTLSLVGGLVSEDIGTAGQDDGSIGYGGAMGGYGAVPAGTYQGNWAGGGPGGNGGCPAPGGMPGTSAGSSVALLVLSGEVIVTRSSLQAGLGGTGGDGGAGGPGGPGQAGLRPASIYPVTCSPHTDALEENCASYGGQGGNGGAGGHGGGGAGGWSIGVLMAPSATSTVDSDTTIAVSKGGVGGSGNGGSRAPSGQAHAKFTLP